MQVRRVHRNLEGNSAVLFLQLDDGTWEFVTIFLIYISFYKHFFAPAQYLVTVFPNSFNRQKNCFLSDLSDRVPLEQSFLTSA